MIAREIVAVVLGTPAPKGSLKCVGRDGTHRLVEDNPRTKAWRRLVAAAPFADEARAAPKQPIGVEVTSTIPRPKTVRGGFPVNKRTGDVDKLARLVLDALTDAGILDDDAQVIEVISRKTFPGGPVPDALDEPGAVVRVYPYTT